MLPSSSIEKLKQPDSDSMKKEGEVKKLDVIMSLFGSGTETIIITPKELPRRLFKLPRNSRREEDEFVVLLLPNNQFDSYNINDDKPIGQDQYNRFHISRYAPVEMDVAISHEFEGVSTDDLNPRDGEWSYQSCECHQTLSPLAQSQVEKSVFKAVDPFLETGTMTLEEEEDGYSFVYYEKCVLFENFVTIKYIKNKQII